MASSDTKISNVSKELLLSERETALKMAGYDTQIALVEQRLTSLESNHSDMDDMLSSLSDIAKRNALILKISSAGLTILLPVVAGLLYDWAMK
jgi:hypothetical protein